MIGVSTPPVASSPIGRLEGIDHLADGARWETELSEDLRQSIVVLSGCGLEKLMCRYPMLC